MKTALRLWALGTWTLVVLIGLLLLAAVLSHVPFLENLSLFAGVSFVTSGLLAALTVLGIILLVLRRCWRCSLLLFVVFLCAALLQGDFSFKTLMAGLGPESKSADAKNGPFLRIAALNVRYYSYGMQKVSEAIKESDVDVALISENEVSREAVPRLQELMRPYRVLMGKRYETGIISRLPVLEFKEVFFPTHQASLSGGNTEDGQEFNSPRSFMHAVVDFHGERVNLISVRLIAGRAENKLPLENLRWGQYLLRTQLREVEFFRRYVATLNGPIVFGGDLNATPSSVVIRRFREFASDSFLQNHGFGSYTFPTYRSVGIRLDYLFHCGTGVEATTADVGRWVVSDHFPVLASYRISMQTKGVL